MTNQQNKIMIRDSSLSDKEFVIDNSSYANDGANVYMVDNDTRKNITLLNDTELKYLKMMIQDYIKQKYPEELL
jgi:hypothetical protein